MSPGAAVAGYRARDSGLEHTHCQAPDARWLGCVSLWRESPVAELHHCLAPPLEDCGSREVGAGGASELEQKAQGLMASPGTTLTASSSGLAAGGLPPFLAMVELTPVR